MRLISLLAIIMVMAALLAASAMPAFAQGPPPNRPPDLAGPPLFAQGPPEGATVVI